jgi:hypothetical protein
MRGGGPDLLARHKSVGYDRSVEFDGICSYGILELLADRQWADRAFWNEPGVFGRRAIGRLVRIEGMGSTPSLPLTLRPHPRNARAESNVLSTG